MHTQICSVNFDLVHGLEGRCHAPPLSGWNLNNHGHDIENNPSQQGLNFRAVSDELPSGNQTWQFTKSPINGGFEWVLGRFGVAMFDSRRGALFQDDSRPWHVAWCACWVAGEDGVGRGDSGGSNHGGLMKSQKSLQDGAPVRQR